MSPTAKSKRYILISFAIFALICYLLEALSLQIFLLTTMLVSLLGILMGAMGIVFARKADEERLVVPAFWAVLLNFIAFIGSVSYILTVYLFMLLTR